MPACYAEYRERVKEGKKREEQIALALISQHNLPLQEATAHEDSTDKVDRWLLNPDGTRTAVQIKYRETSDELLFEVFHTFKGWNHDGNKVGRDMKGLSTLYAVLRQDQRTIVMVPVSFAKLVIAEMLEGAKECGWITRDGKRRFFYHKAGGKCELRVQNDPADGRQKMLAYIPASVFIFEANARTYKVRLPNWEN